MFVRHAAWEYLHKTDAGERERLRNRMKEKRRGDCQTVIAMDEEDSERMKYCRFSTAMKEEDIYALGLELYNKKAVIQ